MRMQRKLFSTLISLTLCCSGIAQTNSGVFSKWFSPGTKTNKAIKLPGDMRFSEYTGADFLEWEVSSGALADTSYDVLIFRGWPSRPYAVIGDIRHRDSNKEWREGEFRNAVKGAKMKGADAIIVRLTSESGVGAFTGTPGKNMGSGYFGHFQMTALLIRWQSPHEIEARAARDARLRKQLYAARPGLNVSSETATLAIKYLLQGGLHESSDEFYVRYEQIMSQISAKTADDLSGEWIFKAVVKERQLVSEHENQYLGLASVRSDGVNVAVISKEGKVEMNFSGQLAKGRLTGQVGVANLSAKAEGVAMEDKISLTYQTVTPTGVTQGTIVLQRNRVKSDQETIPAIEKL